MGRRKPNPAQSLYRFMHGIFDYYVDRGMPKKTAKAKMVDHTFETCVSVMKKEEDVPDEMLVLMAQWMSRALNNRGAQMTKEIRKLQEKSTYSKYHEEKLLNPLHDIKQAKDTMDKFIKTYIGWSELDGKEKN